MSDEERKIMELLAEAASRFNKLIQTHPCHHNDFIDGIHKCQDQLIHRIVQRDYPSDFPSYKKKDLNVKSQK